jgi:Leucine-rich repeat (LRR) protein
MLPESFGQLKALHYLSFFGCSIGKRIRLPSNFGDLTKLKSLFLMKNFMSTIPKSFKDLSALVELDMKDCPNLVVVEALPSNLETLNMGNCQKLTNIPSLDILTTLKYLM